MNWRPCLFLFIAMLSASSASSQPAKDVHSASSENESKKAGGTHLLYGRIEELRDEAGAKIPIKLQSLTPIRDGSLDTKLEGKSSLQSYPTDFRGTWTGELTISSCSFDKSFWEFDPAEADEQSELLRAGIRGRCSVTFYKGKGEETELEPCSVIFAKVSQTANGQPGLPFFYSLHLGDLSSGRGVTGNELSCKLMKNNLKQLSKTVLEQEVVTEDFDRNPRSGKVKTGYSENVLRFTRLDRNRLYLQAATVSYRSDGKFQNKVLLYGTLDRSNSLHYSNQ
ncbi:MAG: hypothetical protein K2X27_01950 [Candidatus Obscuribacterales bacterium]|nr:hypothetical protein [Candidatus Obscuribacterales bacterium]